MAVFGADMGATVAALLFILVLLYNLWRKYPRKVAQSPPQPPQPSGAWPIVGHLPLLGPESNIAHTLAELADKSSAGEHLVYDHASFGFSNGTYWREMRKMVSSEVLSARRLEAMKNLRVTEIGTSIGELYLEATTKTRGQQSLPSKVVISHWVEKMTLNIIVKTIAGKRYGSGAAEVESFRKLIREFTVLSGEFVLSDVIPIPLLRWIDPQGHIKSMKRVSKELDIIIEKWVEEHIQKRGEGEGCREEQDFIDVMLSTIDDKFTTPKLTIYKATVVNVILGGFDTTSVHLTWVLSLLVNNKHVMNLARQEIDDKVGNQRWVQESDINNLPYLHAIIKESLRLYPPLPLSIPHEAVEDCCLSGYHIPKRTLLFVNLWKLHRDARFWPEPNRFMPERFLTAGHAQVDVAGQQYEYIPFGMGRRSCPGATFAMQVTSLTVARLIQGFDFATEGNEAVDMAEGIGITMPRENPLELLVTPRLPSQLYE
ncbi:UNVERIFIED_CONTAM: Xanthotoxin 5-hydroxylase CYP82C2 [Sesamum angustifolium]|uniref:Flavonoid-6-hydroxylase n=1 Tax=Sesamum angustifolium TaxID=2727405 RepID=A0AAW2PS14_9LAMI